MWKLFKNLFSPEQSGTSQGDGRKVLVIDDGEVERQFMAQSLAKAGYTVHAKSDGESGLEAARTIQPDVIILDYLMPGMDGQVVCRKLKSDLQTKDIPIIFLTGSSRPETVITCYDIGADQYLNKPISAKSLIEQVQITLDQNPILPQKCVDKPV